MPSVDILLVEDVAEMRVWLTELFISDPRVSRVRYAASTWEAQNLCLRDRPGGILLDEILPGDPVGFLREEWVRAGIPVILMTGMERPQHGLPEGVRGRVIKPVLTSKTGQTRASEQTFINEVLRLFLS